MNPDAFPIQTNYLGCDGKINAIKKLREITQEHFGVTLGLKLSKDAVESMQALKLAETKDNFKSSLLALAENGVSAYEINELIKDAGVYRGETLYL